ncbi:TBC1 domain family member 4-like isoform X3 [Pomacea canaliculata]|uniref:TBC1 domain family member 4-like isoform X3 n=1 Tax=Pomacea canaliculata TaxID=400727 RepID=UPI000D738048|nr:TBC1 domain family member 4-like isoform X3 [Pomacea canaliculata]
MEEETEASNDDTAQIAVTHSDVENTTNSSPTFSKNPTVNINAPADSCGTDTNTKHKFLVWYLGSATMHRLYTHSVQPWVMAEVKRRRDGIKEVSLEVRSDGMLRALERSPSGQETGEVILEHNIQGLSRFARLHQDPRCFGYLTKSQSNLDFTCHVYLATTERTIHEIFACIQKSTKDQVSAPAGNMGEGTDSSDSIKATYEVKYLGRTKVTRKKLTSDAMDTLAERLMAYEESQLMKKLEEQERRQRHSSGASIQSLPASLDEVVSITENNLGAQLDRLRRGANAASSHATSFQYDSPDSSADDVASGGDTSSSENVLDDSTSHHHYHHQDHKRHHHQDHHSRHHGFTHHSVPAHVERHASAPKMTIRFESVDGVGNEGSPEEVFNDPSSASKGSRAMLLQISQQDICLISLDQKLLILERMFKDIASVSQGNHKKDIFGIVVRQPDSSLMVYILSCHAESVVNEILSTLQTAFMSAFQKCTSQNQVCSLCPLHQLHRLCQEITKLGPHAAYDLLVRRTQNLPERELAELSNKVKMEGPTTYEESVEVIMIALRQLCEQRQRDHTHITEGTKPSKQDTRKKEDAKEAFRKRSWTTDSDGGGSWATRSMDSSVASTPDASPLTSPVSKHFSHDFPSPPGSPEPRKRSSTLGAIPDSSERERAAAKQRLRDVNHNKTQSNSSPMKTMYLMATSPQLPDSSSSSPLTSPYEDRCTSGSIVCNSGNSSRNMGSWRKAIFERVCTPSRDSSHSSAGDDKQSHEKRKKTSAELRSMWKKAMLETLLLIRMEKENSDIRDYFIIYGSRSLVVFKARQEEENLERKLDYKELTPCLRDITKVWDDLLNAAAAGRSEPVQYSTLLDYVKKGVPRSQRGQIWRFLAAQQCLHSHLDQDTSGLSDLGYEDLLKQLTTHQHAILIDLGRTFPGHPYFAKALGPGQLELFNLLKAYSLMDREVGYCQGISFIAGILLMHMEETAAFELIQHLMVRLGLRKQYCPNMMALQIKLYQLMRLIHDQDRELYSHFEAYEIAPALYATPWFLTLFASQFPLGFVARAFDMIFIQGPDVVFKVALMLLVSHRELILQCSSFEGVVDFLKTTLPDMVHVQMERVINQAFELDISKQLQAYEVEYHVFSEEMISSPHLRGQSSSGASASHHMAAMQQTVRKLRQQNLELVEKLQRAHSQQHSLQLAEHEYRVNEDKLKSRIQALELERSALLTTVATLKSLIPESELEKLPHLLQMQSLSACSSPCLSRKSCPSSPVKERQQTLSKSCGDQGVAPGFSPLSSRQEADSGDNNKNLVGSGEAVESVKQGSTDQI